MKKIALAALLLASLAATAKAASYDNLNAGIQLYNLGQWSDAIAELDKALAANDLIPSLQFIAHYDQGRAHLNLAQFDQAIEDYTASLALRPGEAQVLMDRAFAYGRADKLDLAAEDLDHVIAAHPTLSAAYGMRAVLYVKRGQIDKGRDDMKAILKSLPENTPRGTTAGIIKWETGQISDAEDDFSYEASHGPNNIYAWLWYSLAEVRLGKRMPKSSLPDFDKKAWPAPIIGFFNGDTAQDAVFVAAQQGDATQVRGQVCEANFYIGEWLLQHNDQAGAKPLITKAASICPGNFIEWMPAQMDRAEVP